MTFTDCCNAVLTEIYNRIERGKAVGALNFAHHYAIVGLQIGDDDTEARRIQALYLRSNLSTWRGPKAKAVKAALDNFSKRKGVRT